MGHAWWRRDHFPSGTGIKMKVAMLRQVITRIRQACQQSWEIREKGASTPELIQSWLSFSVRSVLGPGVFPLGRRLTRITAERCWAPDRMWQVKRPRSWRAGVHFKAGTSLQPTQASPTRASRFVPRASRSSSLRRDVGDGQRNSQGTNPRTGGHSELKKPPTEVFA